jgi:hypothetical protein
MWESMAYDSHNYVTHENNYMYQVTISHLSSQKKTKKTNNLYLSQGKIENVNSVKKIKLGTNFII